MAFGEGPGNGGFLPASSCLILGGDLDDLDDSVDLIEFL
jgi:hypothetical protein